MGDARRSTKTTNQWYIICLKRIESYLRLQKKMQFAKMQKTFWLFLIFCFCSFFLVNFGLPDKRWRYCSLFVYLLTSLNGCFIVYFFYRPLGGCILRQWLKLWIWYFCVFACVCICKIEEHSFIHSHRVIKLISRQFNWKWFFWKIVEMATLWRKKLLAIFYFHSKEKDNYKNSNYNGKYCA